MVIIGNGLDLDLGLKTGYGDFVNSEHWPWQPNGLMSFNNKGLSAYLIQQSTQARWFDLEQWILEYVAQDGQSVGGIEKAQEGLLDDDILSFDKLVRGLTNYISACSNCEVNKESMAFRLLEVLADNGAGKIYSFNYTDLNDIYQKHRPGGDLIRYSHVHGCVKENNIILGIEPATDVVDGYRFVRKVYQKGYRSHHILYDMLDADEVIIFGHSLGSNDYHHFSEFFRRQSAEDLPKKDSKRITFITNNDNSRMDLLDQLRDMNNKHIDRLFSRNKIDFVLSSDGNSPEFEVLIDRLNKKRTLAVLDSIAKK